MFLAFLESIAPALSIVGGLTDTLGSVLDSVSQSQQLKLDSINLQRQEAVAKSQAEQTAIEQDKKMSHILSAENVEAVSQGTQPAGFSAITMNNIRNFADDRKNLNINERMEEDIFKSKEESVKSARERIPLATTLSVGSSLLKGSIFSDGLLNSMDNSSLSSSDSLINDIFGGK